MRAVIATRHGPEHSKVARAVLRRYSEDVVAFLLQVHGRVVRFLIVDAQQVREAGSRKVAFANARPEPDFR